MPRTIPLLFSTIIIIALVLAGCSGIFPPVITSKADSSVQALEPTQTPIPTPDQSAVDTENDRLDAKFKDFLNKEGGFTDENININKNFSNLFRKSIRK